MRTNRVVLHEDLRLHFGIPHTRQHLSRLEKLGLFPKRLYVGSRAAWSEAEVNAWLSDRMAERGEPAKAIAEAPENKAT